MSYGVGRRHSSDPALLWLRQRVVATAPIRPLAWEPPYATGAALEKKKKKKRNFPAALFASFSLALTHPPEMEILAVFRGLFTP